MSWVLFAAWHIVDIKTLLFFFLFKTVLLGSVTGIRLMLNTKFIEWRSEWINRKSIRPDHDFNGSRDGCSKSKDYSVSRGQVSKLQHCFWVLWVLWVEPLRTVQGHVCILWPWEYNKLTVITVLSHLKIYLWFGELKLEETYRLVLLNFISPQVPLV